MSRQMPKPLCVLLEEVRVQVVFLPRPVARRIAGMLEDVVDAALNGTLPTLLWSLRIALRSRAQYPLPARIRADLASISREIRRDYDARAKGEGVRS